jgi:hypothetical protein
MFETKWKDNIWSIILWEKREWAWKKWTVSNQECTKHNTFGPLFFHFLNDKVGITRIYTSYGTLNS